MSRGSEGVRRREDVLSGNSLLTDLMHQGESAAAYAVNQSNAKSEAVLCFRSSFFPCISTCLPVSLLLLSVTLTVSLSTLGSRQKTFQQIAYIHQRDSVNDQNNECSTDLLSTPTMHKHEILPTLWGFDRKNASSNFCHQEMLEGNSSERK